MRTTIRNILLIILIIAGIIGSLKAQIDNPRRDLEELRFTLNRVASFIRLLPRSFAPELKMTLENKLQEADVKFQQAVQLAKNGHIKEARVLAMQVYGLLRQIEALLRQHPLLKIKFQDQLDRKIQEAEKIVGSQEDPESLYMLNRAKFFRRKAYRLFEEGRTFQAIDYYNLAIHFVNQVMKISGGHFDRFSETEWRKMFMDTQVLLERARHLQSFIDTDRRMRNLLEKAETELNEVKRLYERKNYTAAQQKLITVNRALYRLLDLMESTPQNEQERLRFDAQSLFYALQSIHEQLQEKKFPVAVRLYQRATALARQIERHIQNNQPVLARRKLRFANQIVLNLYRILENRQVATPDELRNQLDAARQNVQDLANQSVGNEDAASFLKLIQDNLDRAEKAYRNKNYLRSGFLLKIVNQMILKYNHLLLQQTRQDVKKGLVESDLYRLETMLKRLEVKTDDAELKIRYQNARRLYQLAKKAYRKDELTLAKEYITMAINLLTR